MRTNAEMRAAIDAVAARLDADPKSVDEWDAIVGTLDEVVRYARKRLNHWRRLRINYSKE